MDRSGRVGLGFDCNYTVVPSVCPEEELERVQSLRLFDLGVCIDGEGLVLVGVMLIDKLGVGDNIYALHWHVEVGDRDASLGFVHNCPVWHAPVFRICQNLLRSIKVTIRAQGQYPINDVTVKRYSYFIICTRIMYSAIAAGLKDQLPFREFHTIGCDVVNLTALYLRNVPGYLGLDRQSVGFSVQLFKK